MFPSTYVSNFVANTHIETVVLLSRKKVEETIHIKLDVEDINLKLSKMATYQEIQEYVLKNYGFKVSTLYISQVKAKCGITERECYNKGNNKSRVPQCPKDKENAIMDAFRHFGMIE